MRRKSSSYLYFPNVSKNIVFSPENPQPQSLFSEGQVKVITIGLEPGQNIPIHPEGLTVYIFLKGKGWMIVNGERLAVHPGATVITPAGAQRGVEAITRLSFQTVRIFALPNDPIRVEAYKSRN
jgi:quercetin dioxygenase-like cupin family protein